MVTEAIFGMSDERVTKAFFGISDELKQELKQELKDAVKEALEPLEPCYKNNGNNSGNGSGGDKIGLFDNNSDAYQPYQKNAIASLDENHFSAIGTGEPDPDFGFNAPGYDDHGFNDFGSAPSIAA